MVMQNEMQAVWTPPYGVVECYSLELVDEKGIGGMIVIYETARLIQYNPH